MVAVKIWLNVVIGGVFFFERGIGILTVEVGVVGEGNTIN